MVDEKEKCCFYSNHDKFFAPALQHFAQLVWWRCERLTTTPNGLSHATKRMHVEGPDVPLALHCTALHRTALELT